MNNIDQIIDEYGRRIHKYCYGMLRDKQEAEDAVQEVFLKAYKNMDKMGDIQSISSWLYRVAYNHCLNIIRKKKLLSFIPIKEDIKVEECNGDLGIEENEFSETITMVISKLSPEDRSVLLLRILEEKSYQEIAHIFNKQPDAIRKQYERARKKVKKYIEVERGANSCEKISIL